MAFVANAAFPASITPMPTQVAVQGNYIDFHDAAFSTWTQQYLPELYEQEVERYGNRTLSGFLKMVGAEMPMTSDQVIWSEQNRLHVAYANCAVAAGGHVFPDFRVTITPGAAEPTSAIRDGNTILISDNATGLTTLKALVTNRLDAGLDGYTIECHAYTGAALAAALTAGTCSIYVYGSEFPKGSNGMEGAIEPGLTTYSNNPIILKDNYELSGSDAAQIGWIEVATEDGTSGYLWYLKAESETRLRFEDYMEMSMVEGEINANAANFPIATFPPATVANQAILGTQGLFAALEARGNVYSGFAGAAAPGSGAMGDFDVILNQLDKQGAIEENMLFLSRQTALDFDDMIAAMNGNYASSAAASYGLFENEAEMALNFGFSGFRRGSYDFYKTDWKYLNDATTRGMSSAIDGVLVPAGTSTVYDQMLGSNIRRPFLHVRYRASETEDRRFKSWITGSVGGAYTSDLDTMRVNFLSERCLVTQAANNFVLFQGA